MDLVQCPWCSTASGIGYLIGLKQSLCPCCGLPILQAPFGALKAGSYFLCDLGGKWEKSRESHAVCIADDEANREGDIATFTEDSPVYPCRVADFYPLWECPDCAEDIPESAVNGDACAHCGHVLTIQTQVDAVC